MQQFDYFFDFYHDTNLTARLQYLADIVYYCIFPNTATSLFPMNKLQCVLFFKMCLIRSVVSSLPILPHDEFTCELPTVWCFAASSFYARSALQNSNWAKEKKNVVGCVYVYVYVVCFMPCSQLLFISISRKKNMCNHLQWHDIRMSVLRII